MKHTSYNKFDIEKELQNSYSLCLPICILTIKPIV